MALKGNLTDMSLTTLVQVNCEERNQARLLVRDQGKEASIFFEDGNIVHMVLGDIEGEEVIYKLLTWEEGTFELEQGIPPPAHTVTAHWSGLLLEAVHFIDEGTVGLEAEIEMDEQEETERKEVSEMAKKRSEILTEHLETLLGESADINGAVIVGSDGLVLASNMPLGGHDATRVGAEGAALLGLGRRTLSSMKCGEFKAVILEGKNGWIIAVGAGERQMVFGLTDADVNLGMALMEMRDIAADVEKTMG